MSVIKITSIQDIDNVMMQGFYFFAKQGCKYCDLLSYEFEKQCISYTKLLLDPMDDQVVNYLKLKTVMNTFPMVFNGHHKIGGYQDTLNYLMTQYIDW